MFQQALNPTGNLFVSWLLALIPVAVLLILLAVFRLSAWKAVLVGAIVTFVLAMIVWGLPVGVGIRAYIYGSLTGIWAVDWITFWGVMLFNSLTLTGVFDQFRRWLIAQGTADVRVQAILFAWAFGALLEGLVGFGYPWAFVAPILVGLGIPDFDALRVAAIANNAPVSYGALGVPIIALSAVTGLPLLALCFGRAHRRGTCPAATMGTHLSRRRSHRVPRWLAARCGGILGYIAGQYPVAVYLGPYLPDVTGAIVSFSALLLLLKFWRPRSVLGYGGKPVDDATAVLGNEPHGLTSKQILRAWGLVQLIPSHPGANNRQRGG